MIPQRTKYALDCWVKERVRGGFFIDAVLANDLARAVRTADAENLAALPEILSYVFEVLPATAWRYPEIREHQEILVELENKR